MDITPPPIRSSLEQYEKLAGDLVEAYSSGDDGAMQRIRDHAQRTFTWDQLRALMEQQLDKLPDSRNRSVDVSLADARLLVAGWDGFESWQALLNHMEAVNKEPSVVWQFERAVDAVITGNVATLESLLGDNPEIIRARSTREHQATLLHYISANGVEDFRQKTPKNAVEVAKLLLATGAEVDAVQADGESTTLGLVATSVHPWVAGVQIALMETLLDAGAAVDGAPAAWNPLIAALHNGRGEAAEFLAQRGARLDLEGAAGVGRLDLVKSFFNRDGSLKAVRTGSGPGSPAGLPGRGGGSDRVSSTKDQLQAGFAWACEYGRTNVVDFLLQNGLDVGTKLKHNGQTGLHWAAYGGHRDTVKLLLERKAPIDIKDESFGGTPLEWALYGWGELTPELKRSNYYEVVALLVAAGAVVDPEWLADPDREMPLPEKLRADPRMLAALGGELPAW